MVRDWMGTARVESRVAVVMVAVSAAVVLFGFRRRHQRCHSQDRGTDNDQGFAHFAHDVLHATQGVSVARTVAEGERRRCFT